MAATVEVAKVTGGPSALIQVAKVTAFSTPGPRAYVQIAALVGMAPTSTPARVQVASVRGFAQDAFNNTTLWRERVDGVWQIPEWTPYVRVDGVFVPA